MLSYKKLSEQADAFAKAYPTSLARRLEWWCKVLGTNRVRFLRLLGMTQHEAEENQEQTWAKILKNRYWNDRGLGVEEILCSTLALYHYDWKTLAKYLQEARLRFAQKMANGNTGSQSQLTPSVFASNQERSEFLLRLLALGTQDGFGVLFDYLATAAP